MFLSHHKLLLFSMYKKIKIVNLINFDFFFFDENNDNINRLRHKRFPLAPSL